VFLSDASPAAIAAFEAWRGRRVDVVLDWSNRATWSDVEAPTFLYREWQNTPYTKVFGVAMLPEGVPGVSLQACARGDYNAHWLRFGRTISAYKLGAPVIRLGWEFNGSWYLWTASSPKLFASCWRQIVTTVRRTAPRLRWDWNVNRGISGGLADPRQAWPGDAYVDIVGVDSYDHWPAATTASGWRSQLGPSSQGLTYWLDFARKHHKPLSVPEWGSQVTGPSAGGDNAQYVKWMADFFRTNAGMIAYESLFQGESRYFPRASMPKAAAAYRQVFGPR
jgi:hypothetical protein